MKAIVILLALLLSPLSHSDSMSRLIDTQLSKLVSVYEVQYMKDGKVKKVSVNAVSIEQTMLTIREQLKVADKDVVNITLKSK